MAGMRSWTGAGMLAVALGVALSAVLAMPAAAGSLEEVLVTASDLRQVQVLDATGRLVVDRHVQGTDRTLIGLEDLPSGLLVVRVRTEAEWSVHRLVKD